MMKPFLYSLMLVGLTGIILAHPGHPEAPGESDAASDGTLVELSKTQAENLKLRTVKAQVASVAPTLEIPAVLVLSPERHARVTAPFTGRVTELMVKLGDQVQKGQPLMRVAPLTLGSAAQELKAPLDGVVFEQTAVIGLPFTAETTLMQTGDYRELLARGNFYQSPELAKISSGQKVILRLDVFPDETFEGTVQRIDPGHEIGSPFFHIYALVPNASGKLRPNYRVRLFVEIGSAHQGVVVPARAILGRLNDKFLFVETEPLHFERRPVVTGQKSGDTIEILEGLKAGEPVVTEGHYQLQYSQTGHREEAATKEGGHQH